MSHLSCLSGTATDRVLAIVGRCGGGREGKDGWMVCCPAHEDSSPSLSVKAERERVLLHCFAGCATTAIVAAIALSMHDLFADDGGAPCYAPCHVSTQQRRLPPDGAADPLALAFAVDAVIDDVGMLTVEGLITVVKQASGDPLQRLWMERAFARSGMTPALVWQALSISVESSTLTQQPPGHRPVPSTTVHIQGRVPSTMTFREEDHHDGGI